MLTEGSYFTAIYIYSGAAVMIMLCLAWWLGRRWRSAWVVLVVLLAGALLLTPAYPKEGISTLAPALIVAGFQLATEGLEAAQHALKPLAYACGLALVLALIMRFTFFRSKNHEATETGQLAESD